MAAAESGRGKHKQSKSIHGTAPKNYITQVSWGPSREFKRENKVACHGVSQKKSIFYLDYPAEP